MPGHPTQPLYFPVPRPVIGRPIPQGLALDVELSGNLNSGLLARLLARNLNFEQIVQFGTDEAPIERRLSSMQAGTLYFVALKDRKHTLRRGEWLELTDAEGEIRELTLGPDGIHMRFYGRANNVIVGIGAYRRSLMPSLLEWLKTRHGVVLFWSTSLYVLSQIIVIFRWWGKPL
jgi:hypothetical protein